MSALRGLQQGFQAYVLDTSGEPPASVVSNETAGAVERLNIYADGLWLRFAEVLEQDFPGVHGLLGDRQFGHLCRAYAQANPSTQQSIRWFGRHLPRFLRERAPWCESPILGEMAVFEWSKGELLDECDDSIIGFDEMTATPPQDWALMRPRFVRAIRRLDLHSNAVPLWQALNDEDAEVPEVCLSKTPQAWLLWRQELSLRWRSINAQEAWAISFFQDTGTFGELCEALIERVGPEHAPGEGATLLRQWVNDGVLRSV